MRYMGILGVIVFIAIAYICSKNRKKINWHTVAWGLGLQILFALTILGNMTVSFIGAFILLSIVAIYLSVTRMVPWCQHHHPFSWARSLSGFSISMISILKMAVIPLALGYYFGFTSAHIITISINVIWGLIALICILRAFISNQFLLRTPINSGLFLIAVSLSLGLTLAIAISTNGIQGTMAYNLQQLSISVGTFLSVPTHAGASMIFGSLTEIKEPWYFLFFVQVLPTIIFFSAFISVLYHLGIIQILIEEMSLFMRWTMKTSGAETLSCSGNIFVGQTEAPILIKPYIKDMTKSEIHAIMTGGFATISGGVFAGFVAMGIEAGHMISASVMSAPAALMLSKIFYPETEISCTAGDTPMPKIKTSDNLIGAAAQGTSDGLQLALNVGAMLLAFIALITVVDMGLGAINEAWSLNAFLGSVFQYLAFIMGVSLQDIHQVGILLGNKIAINEFVAYGNLAELIKNESISPRSQAIATYALCGFANLSSIGIQIGGITPMAPERRSDITKAGFSAMCAGAFASWITAAIAGLFIG